MVVSAPANRSPSGNCDGRGKARSSAMVLRTVDIGWRAPGSEPTLTAQRSVPHEAASGSSASCAGGAAIEGGGAGAVLGGAAERGQLASANAAAANESSHHEVRIDCKISRARQQAQQSAPSLRIG